MGIAYLPDGSSMDYKEYIAAHPHWQVVRRKRLFFDENRCVVCHKRLTEGDRFETHHLYYTNLGNEHLTDVVTMCPVCHVKFHNAWKKQEFWKGREQNHWVAYNIEHTAKICILHYQDDKYLSKNPNGPNLCNKDNQRILIEQYLSKIETSTPILIDPNDIGLFVRNKRYELFFDAESRGLSIEQFLDETYGEKIRGKNPLRVEAGQFFGKHEPKKIHRHYKENSNINELMKLIKKIEKEN